MNFPGHITRLGLTPDLEVHVRRQLRAAPPGASNLLVRADGSVLHRPDRPFSDLITVDPRPHVDLRAEPTIKGPDLEWLATRLGISRERGYDEGFLQYNGRIVEAIFSALIMFDRDCAVCSTHPRALPSTTLPLVKDWLVGAGYQVEEVPGFASIPTNSRLWLVNAFSGVRSANGPDPEAANRWLWERADII